MLAEIVKFKELGGVSLRRQSFCGGGEAILRGLDWVAYRNISGYSGKNIKLIWVFINKTLVQFSYLCVLV